MLKKEALKITGRKVTVMRDLNVARFYFHRTEEVYQIDQYALSTSAAYFLVAMVSGSFLGYNWGSLLLGERFLHFYPQNPPGLMQENGGFIHHKMRAIDRLYHRDLWPLLRAWPSEAFAC